MLRLGSTYLIVKDIEKSVKFYEALLEMKVTARNYTRWAHFNFRGNCIGLMNQQYDEERFKSEKNPEDTYSKEYIEYFKDFKTAYGNHMVLNFCIDDLEAEYKRLEKLNIGTLSPIMSLNVAMPYYFFLIEDPDGNKLEIMGDYKGRKSY